MSTYRKIYEQQYGEIPKDSDGRSYDIHHIDGNHKNDSPDNLKAVTIQEHYNIHYAQGDWYACLRIAEKMKLSPEEISKLAKKNSRKRLADGSHNLLKRSDGSSHASDRVVAGTHHFLTDNPNANGKISKKLIVEKKHNFITNHPNKIKVKCPYCLLIGGETNMHRWHFDNCKSKS